MNLHIALVMDCTNNKFILNCESNPALYKECAVQWMEGWSRDSMVKVSLFSTVIVALPSTRNVLYNGWKAGVETAWSR